MFSWLRSKLIPGSTPRQARHKLRRYQSRRILLEPLEKREVFAIELVSAAGTTANGNNDSINADISDDHRYVVFESDASNLVAGDINGVRDIFLKDLTTGALSIISTSSTGTRANGASQNAVISGNGRYVAFESNATNLVTGDTNNATDIFLKDLVTGTTTRLSVSSTGVQSNGGSSNATISIDGRYVAFDSGASNLVTGDTNGLSDIFRRDTTSNTTVRVSLTSGNQQGNGASFEPSITPNGRHIAFTSYANNLVANDTNLEGDVFTKDVTGRGITLDSRGPSFQGNALSSRPKISDDARYVVFESNATTLVNGDTNNARDIFLRDRQANVTIRVSLTQTNQQANGASFEPAISGDGKFVVFQSLASNLVPNDTNLRSDIFEKEIDTGRVNRWSVSDAGVQGNGNSFRPVNTTDSRYLVFDTEATNLYSGDTTNGNIDVYFQTINGVPVAQSAAYTTPFNTLLPITLVGTDPEDDSLSFRIIQGPQNGRFTGTLPRINYIPNNGFSGTDTIRYVVNDGRGDSAVATITITVSPDDGGGGNPGSDDQYIIGFNPANGEWFGSHLADGTSRVLTTWSPSAGWNNGLVADFNGDGLSDIAARTATGRWWVGLAQTGGLNPAFTTSLWGGSSRVPYQTVVAADVNNDGSADIVTFSNALNKSWQILTSTNTSFNAANINWRSNVNWTDFQVADFNGDGRDDIAARIAPATGGFSPWWVGISNGAGVYATSRWGRWENSNWRDVMVGDYNNDGFADIVGQTPNGNWRMARSNGTSFNTLDLGSWASVAAAGWQNVMTGDFNGDGRDDVIGRTNTGDWFWWYLAGNSAIFPAASLARWQPAQNFRGIQVADIGNDGKSDLLGRSGTTGTWRVDTLNTAATALVQSTDPLLSPTWNQAVNWVFEDVGEDDGTVF